MFISPLHFHPIYNSQLVRGKIFSRAARVELEVETPEVMTAIQRNFSQVPGKQKKDESDKGDIFLLGQS